MKLYLKSWFWVVFFGLICCTCLAIYLLPKGGNGSIGVYQNGELIYLFSEEELHEDREIVIEYMGGTNTLLISEGSVSVTDASCPDGDCIRHGPLEQGGTPIICLPNRLVIRYMGENENKDVDAISGEIK